MLRYRDAPAAIDWLCQVFGSKRHLVVEDDEHGIAHAQLVLGGGMVMLATAREDEFGRLLRLSDEVGGAQTQTAYVVVTTPTASARGRRRPGRRSRWSCVTTTTAAAASAATIPKAICGAQAPTIPGREPQLIAVRDICTPSIRGRHTSERMEEFAPTTAFTSIITMPQYSKSPIGDSLRSVRKLLTRPLGRDTGRTAQDARAPAARSQSTGATRRAERLMKRELYQLLDLHPASRQMVRHLDLLERTFYQGGLESLEGLPVRVLAKALDELERLVWDWSPIGLAELRSRVAVMVKARSAESDADAPSTGTLMQDLLSQPDVSEIDRSVFEEEVERGWAGRVPKS